MKFTNGFWQMRPGIHALYAAEAYDIEMRERSLVVTAPTQVVKDRGGTLNRPVLTVTLHSPLPGVIGVKIEHFQGTRQSKGFALTESSGGHAPMFEVDATSASISSGALTATVTRGAPWNLAFSSNGRVLTSSGHKSSGYIQAQAGHTSTSSCRSASANSSTVLVNGSVRL